MWYLVWMVTVFVMVSGVIKTMALFEKNDN